MQFGVFDHLDRCDGSLADFYADRLAIVDAYDREEARRERRAHKAAHKPGARSRPAGEGMEAGA